MATITRGRFKGDKVTLHQWANDWFSVKESAVVLSPFSIELTQDEMEMVIANPCGLFNYFDLNRDTGRFRRAAKV